jgi:hypothetical protein
MPMPHGKSLELIALWTAMAACTARRVRFSPSKRASTGLAMKAEAEGFSNEVKGVIHRLIAVCESQIQRLGEKILTH